MQGSSAPVPNGAADTATSNPCGKQPWAKWLIWATMHTIRIWKSGYALEVAVQINSTRQHINDADCDALTSAEADVGRSSRPYALQHPDHSFRRDRRRLSRRPDCR